jgi:hypothetical protein
MGQGLFFSNTLQQYNFELLLRRVALFEFWTFLDLIVFVGFGRTE